MEKELLAKSSTASKERKSSRRGKAAAAGLVVPRYFTTPGVDPADELAWDGDA